MWDFVVTHFNSYAGWGLIFFYYLAAVIWLLVTEKRKERRILFVYMPLVILMKNMNAKIQISANFLKEVIVGLILKRMKMSNAFYIWIKIYAKKMMNVSGLKKPKKYVK